MIHGRKVEVGGMVIMGLGIACAMFLSMHAREVGSANITQSSNVQTESSYDSNNPTTSTSSGNTVEYHYTPGTHSQTGDSTNATTTPGTTQPSEDTGASGNTEASPTQHTPTSSSTASTQETTATLERPHCPIGTKAGRIIVTFDAPRIQADKENKEAQTKVMPISLSAGTYTVTLAAWDGYEGRERAVQAREQFRVVLLAQDKVIAQSNPTTDLTDGVPQASTVDIVNTDLVLTKAATGIRALHDAYRDQTNSQSVTPLCAAFDATPASMKEPANSVKPEETVSTVAPTPRTNTLEKKEELIQCAQDTMRCPDGSYVSRTAPQCQFAACPKHSVVATDDDAMPAIAVERYEPKQQKRDSVHAPEPESASQQLSPEEARALLDRLKHSPQAPVPSRPPSEREAVVIAERRHVLERVPQRTQRFDTNQRESIVQAERTKQGVKAVSSDRPVGSILQSPIDDIELLVARESKESVELDAPRSTVATEERTDDFELGLQRLVYANRMDITVLRDSDDDGISDYDEVYVYETNPYDAHTGGSLLTDGERLALGLDPHSTSAQRVIVSTPEAFGEEDPRAYRVSAVELIAGSEETPESIKLSGLAPLNSLVTLVMFSEPIIVTVKANENGNWEYTLNVPVPEGRHELYVTAVNSAGDIVTKSPRIPFVRTANAVEFTPLSGATSRSGVLAGNFLSIALALFLAIGFVLLVVIGLSHRQKGTHTHHGGNALS